MQKNSGLVILSEQLLRLGKQLRSRRTPITTSKPECVGFLQSDKRPDQRAPKEVRGPSTPPYDSKANRIAPRGARTHISYSELMFARNSPFDLVLLSLSISSSIASTGERGFSTLRNTQMRVRSSFGISNSSLRVPER